MVKVKDDKNSIHIRLEEDETSRSDIRAVILLGSELKETGRRKPIRVGLAHTPAYKDYFGLDNVAGKSVLEFSPILTEAEIDDLRSFVVIHKGEVLDVREYEYEPGNIVSRVLIDSKKLI